MDEFVEVEGFLLFWCFVVSEGAEVEFDFIPEDDAVVFDEF